MLTLKNIQLAYAGQIILKDLNLHMEAGEFLVILGSNGSGKSSLLKLIDQRYPLQQGEILLEGHPLKYYAPKSLAHEIVTLSQNPLEALFPCLTVEENFQLALNRSQSQKISSDYLAEFNPKLCEHLSTLVEKLSGGEQQSLALALACLAKPKILLLDEHTSALDPHTAERLMRLTATHIKAKNMTCLFTTHNLALAAQYGNRLIALKHGKIIQDFSAPTKNTLSLEDLKSLCYI